MSVEPNNPREAATMITADHRTAADTYATALVAGLKGQGLDASATSTPGLPIVSVAGTARFLIYFRAGDDKKQSLRVCWDTEDGRTNRPAGNNVAAVAADAAAAARLCEERNQFVLAERARVNAAHDRINALRAEYGLAEDAGDVRVEETNYNTGRFDVTFKTGSPEKVAVVLASLRAAGLI